MKVSIALAPSVLRLAIPRPGLLLLGAFALTLLLTAQSASAASVTTTTLAMTSAGGPVTSVVLSTVVTLTATVRAGPAPVALGQVNFCDGPHCTDIHLLATAQLTSAGVATFKFRPSLGSHQYHAVFAGTNSYAPSSSAAGALSVSSSVLNGVALFLSASGTSPYTLTTTVTRGGPATPVPTGTISIVDTTAGNAVLGSAGLVSDPSATTWGAYEPTPADTEASSVIAGDFNGDGFPDVAFTSFDSTAGARVTVDLGNGDGTFRSSQILGTGAPNEPPSSQVITADFNSDGILDLAVLNPGPSSSTLQVFLGKGDGTFFAAIATTTGQNATAIAVADFDHDGKSDLAIGLAVPGTQAAGGVAILLGKGNGTFTTGVSPAIGSAYTLAIGDFDGDGNADLAVSSAGAPSNLVTILLGKGDGTFNSGWSLSIAPSQAITSIAVGDFNGDGFADLVLSPNIEPLVAVYLGKGDGDFTAGPALPQLGPVGGDTFVAVGDFDGNGIPDFAELQRGQIMGSPGSQYADASVLTFQLGKGDGTFIAAQHFSGLYQYGASWLAVADFDGQGLSDLAAVDTWGDIVPYFTDPVVPNSLLTIMVPALVQTSTAVNIVPGPGKHIVEAIYSGDAHFTNPVPTNQVTLFTPTMAALTLTPSSLSFASSPLGSTSATQTVTVTNTGTSAARIGTIAFTGANTKSFLLAGNTCKTPLNGGASCALSVEFKPAVIGSLTASLGIANSGTSSPVAASLTGTATGVATLSLSLSPASLSFAPMPVGTTSAAQTVTLQNTGTTTIEIGTVALAGANTKSFVVSARSCGSTVNPGQSCTFSLQFKPAKTGALSASLGIADNVSGSPQYLPLGGTGN